MLTLLQRQLAKDQAAISHPLSGQPKTMVDDDDPNNGTAPAPSPEETVTFLQAILAGAPDKDALLEAVAQWVSTAGSGAGAGDGVPDNNKPVMDRKRAGARDRRPAQDSHVRSLNHANFLRRFPDAAKVDAWR